MDIEFSSYELTPLKKLNRLSSIDSKKGIFLSTRINNKRTFADFFPHTELGDQSTENFLDTFGNQTTEYQRKLLELLQKDLTYQTLGAVKFLNHTLWDQQTSNSGEVFKYKIKDATDTSFHSLVKERKRVRLDANGLLKPGEFKNLLRDLTSEDLNFIDYIEDPMESLDWSEITLPCARDFIKGGPHQFTVYKPNARMKPDGELIFSNYMGSNLGMWHAYSELITQGNLKAHHGIVTPDLYVEEGNLFIQDGKYHLPDMILRDQIYRNLHKLPWRKLCSV